MRVLLAGTLVFGTAMVVAAPTASADPGERIASYDVSVTIANNGSAHVTEKIAYDFGPNQRHGITRETRGLKLAGPAKATSPDGAPTTVTMGDTYIKVGDPGVTVTGAHTYVLEYDALDVASLTGADAAVWWSVSDGSWNVPMASVTGTITVPSAAKLNYCYVKATDCRNGVATVDGGVVRVHLSALPAKESLRVKATFSPAGMTLSPVAAPTSHTAPTYTTSTTDSSSSDTSSGGTVGTVLSWLIGLLFLYAFVQLLIASSKKGDRRRARRGGRYRSSRHNTGSSYDSYSAYTSASSYDSSSSYDSGSSSSSDSGSSSSSSDSGSSGSW